MALPSPRRVLLDLVSRVVLGRRVPTEDRATLDSRLRLMGFRRTALGYLRSGGSASGSDLVLLAQALGGSFRIAVASDDAGVGAEILSAGTYEPHIAAFYRTRLRPGMSVVDVGANIGFHALHAAHLVGAEGRVLAVEPDPGNAALLRLSLALPGNPAGVDLVEAALSDADGEIVLTDLGNSGNSGARFTHPDRTRLERLVHGPRPQFRTVRALRFDAHYGDRPVDLIKVDVEGFEPKVIAGMAAAIERRRPVVLSEFSLTNLREIGDVDPESYLAWFRSRGYACAIVEEPDGRLTGAVPREVIDRLARGGRHHLDLAFLPPA
jgi:FkbM family methyltransferase